MSDLRAVLVVELDLDDDAEIAAALVDATRSVSASLEGIPVRAVWAGIRETAEAVAALHPS